MNATILNIKSALLSLLPLIFLFLSQVKYPKFFGNTKLWAILFHLAFIARIWLQIFIPKNPQLLLGIDMLMVSLLLTMVSYLNIDQLASKKIKTIWKIPLVGSLAGLYIPTKWGPWALSAGMILTCFIVWRSRHKLYLMLKPMVFVTVVFLVYQSSMIINGQSWSAMLFGLISYIGAVKIVNMSQLKEWAISIESN